MSQFSTQITTRYVNHPKPGFPNASIKDTGGTNWGLARGVDINWFQKDQTYDITYEEVQKGNKTYFNITGLAQGAAQQRPQPPQGIPPAARPAPQQYAPSDPQRPNQGNAGMQSPGYQHTLDDAAAKDRRITRLALAKSMIETYPLQHLQSLGVAEQLPVAEFWLKWVYEQ